MKVLKIEFGENEKAQNKKISRYARLSTSAKINQEDARTYTRFFESQRELFYGPDWLKLLFPYLNY